MVFGSFDYDCTPWMNSTIDELIMPHDYNYTFLWDMQLMGYKLAQGEW